MSFEKINEIDKLFNQLRYLHPDQRRGLLLNAGILENEVEDLLRQAVEYLNDENVADSFEENLENYIETYFADSTTGSQQRVLDLVIKHFTALEVEELQSALDKAGYKYQVTKEYEL